MRTKRINIRGSSRGCWCTRMVKTYFLIENGVMHFWRINDCCATDSCAPTRISFSKFIIESIKNFVATSPPALLGTALFTAPHAHITHIGRRACVYGVCHTSALMFTIMGDFNEKKNNKEKIWETKCVGQNGEIDNDRSRRDWVTLMRNKSYWQKRCVKNEPCAERSNGWTAGRKAMQQPSRSKWNTCEPVADGRFFIENGRQWRRRNAE